MVGFVYLFDGKNANVSVKLLYYLIVLPLAQLPLKVLYVLSDLLYFIISRVITYRSGVVRQNMEKAFPEWEQKEVDRQIKRFYRHFSNLVIEGLKSFTIDRDELDRRFEIEEPDWLREMAQNGQSVILTAGHYGNWEWFGLHSTHELKHQPVGVYLPMRNKFFNKKFYQSRSRFGMELVTTKEFKEHIKHSDEHPYIYFMMTDQSPTNAKRAIWTTFLGRETAVQYGVEKYAKKYDLPVIYVEIFPDARGIYSTRYKLLTAHPRETEKGEITRMHVKALEESIQRDPAYWLWTHRRWKHDTRPEERTLY